MRAGQGITGLQSITVTRRTALHPEPALLQNRPGAVVLPARRLKRGELDPQRRASRTPPRAFLVRFARGVVGSGSPLELAQHQPQLFAVRVLLQTFT